MICPHVWFCRILYVHDTHYVTEARMQASDRAEGRIRAFFAPDPEWTGMSFEEGDAVILHDKHSDHDGEQGTITQVMETMFGDANYTVSFDDGQEAGISEDQLELAE